MRQIYLCCIFMMVLTLAISQDKKSFSLDLSVGYNTFFFNKSSIYASAHEHWNGLSIKTEALLYNKWLVGVGFLTINATINNKSEIFSTDTNFENRFLIVGYHHNFKNHFVAEPFLGVTDVNGSNQGKFEGVAFTLGAQLKYFISKGTYVSFTNSYDYMNFDIKGPADIIAKFNRAHVFQSSIRIGQVLF